MITILFVALLCSLFWLESRFENSQFQTSNLNPIKSENTAFIKKKPLRLLSLVINVAFSSALVRWCSISY